MNNLITRFINKSDIDRIIRWHTRYGPIYMVGGLVALIITAVWTPLTSQLALGSILCGLINAGSAQLYWRYRRIIFLIMAPLSGSAGLMLLMPSKLFSIELALLSFIQYMALLLITFYIGIWPARRQRR